MNSLLALDISSLALTTAQLIALLLGGVAGLIGTLGEFRDRNGRITSVGRGSITVIIGATVCGATAVVLEALQTASERVENQRQIERLTSEIRRGATPLSQDTFRVAVVFRLTADEVRASGMNAERDIEQLFDHPRFVIALQIREPQHMGGDRSLEADLPTTGAKMTSWVNRDGTGSIVLASLSPTHWSVRPSFVSYWDLSGQEVCVSPPYTHLLWANPDFANLPHPQIDSATIAVDGRQIHLERDAKLPNRRAGLPGLATGDHRGDHGACWAVTPEMVGMAK